MNENKIKTAIGFATKAGKCFTGDYACRNMINAKKAKYIILSDDASKNTKEKFFKICDDNSIPILEVSFDIGAVTGREGRKVAVITNKSFADMIYSSVNTLPGDWGENI